MTDIEAKVTISPEHDGYIVTSSDGTLTLRTFDEVTDEIERVSIELVGREVLPADALDEPHMPARGSMEAWDHLQNIRASLARVCEEQDEPAVAYLSPQLVGLEGWSVEVVDTPGAAPRQFVVGRTPGWTPHHVEVVHIKLSRRAHHRRARMKYHVVDEIEHLVE